MMLSLVVTTTIAWCKPRTCLGYQHNWFHAHSPNMKLRYSMHPRHNSQTLVNLPAFRNAHLSSFHRFGGPFESDHNVPQFVRFMHSRQHRYHKLALVLVKKESSSLGTSQARPLLEHLSGLLARAEGMNPSAGKFSLFSFVSDLC